MGTYSVALQADGKIVAVGWRTKGNFDIERYLANGSLDTSFNGTGRVSNAVMGTATSVAVQSNGKILDNFTTALVRYHGDPLPIIAVEQPAGTDIPNGNGNLVEFGPVVSGSSGSKTFTLRNTGTGDLTGLSVAKAVDGTPADFTIGPLGVTTLPPNASTTFTVTFSPTAAGVRTATLQVARNVAEESPFEINLAGRQAAPLEAWRQMHFGSPYNTGAGADVNDADGVVA